MNKKLNLVLASPKNKEGFSLIEVLIALVIFSFALVGVASIMTLSMRGNHNGYIRSQASILSIDIVSRMQANLAGLWEGHYNGTVSAGDTTCTIEASCTPEQLANYDMESWYDSLQQLLPNSTGQISCPEATLPVSVRSSGLWVAYPPFPEVCLITITWNEINEVGATPQSVTLAVQP